MSSTRTGSIRGRQWLARSVLIIGVSASVAANYLHARPDVIARCISMWPPLALLLAVELISRIPVSSRMLSWVRILATVAIAVIAAWVSYWHMVAVALRFGETDASPYLLPLSVDGLVIVGSVCMMEMATRAAAAAAAVQVALPARVEPDRLVDAELDLGSAIEEPDLGLPDLPARRPRGRIAVAVETIMREHPDTTVPELVNATGGSKRHVARLRERYAS